MIEDEFHILSNFRPSKKSISVNVKEFYELFESFYTKVLGQKIPDFPYDLRDPYGFALLCEDYKPIYGGVDTDTNPSCEKAFLNGFNTPFDSVLKHKFSFKVLLDLLYRGYYFDYDLAMNIYEMQNNPLRIFKEIMNGHGFIMNRLAPNKKKVGKLMNFAYDSKITLNENRPIGIPYKHRVCDGKTWPCIVSRSYQAADVVKDDTDGFGEGLFIVNNHNNIIDCLKINDLWLVDTSLDNRLKFAVHSRNHEVEPFMKAFSWRSAFDAGKILKCNKDEGLLIRPCHEDYFKNIWFEWSKNSLIYCCSINNELRISNRGKSKPDFFTLEGYLGEVNPYEKRLYERIWLDDFDIQEFQRILKL